MFTNQNYQFAENCNKLLNYKSKSKTLTNSKDFLEIEITNDEINLISNCTNGIEKLDTIIRKRLYESTIIYKNQHKMDPFELKSKLLKENIWRPMLSNTLDFGFEIEDYNDECGTFKVNVCYYDQTLN